LHLRQILLSLILSFALIPIAAPLYAQGNGSSQNLELYDTGMSLYSQEDYQSALETFRRIDPNALASKQQRIAMYQAMKDCDQRIRETTTPTEMIAQAQAAEASGHLPRAIGLYELVISNPTTTETQQQAALDHSDRLKRQLAEQQALARQSINDAESDIEAGRLNEAEQKLLTVKTTEIDLSWFDNERVDNWLARIVQLRAMQTTNSSAPVQYASASNDPNELFLAQADPADVFEVQPVQPLSQSSTSNVDLLDQAKKLRVQEKLALAREAERSGQYFLAMKLYQDALALDPGNREAQDALAEAQSRTEEAANPASDLLDAELQSRTLRSSATVAEFEELINRATSLLDARNFQAARQTVQQAKINLDMNKQNLPEAKYDSLRETATSLSIRIDESDRAYASDQTKLLEEARRQQSEQRRRDTLLSQQSEVQSLLVRSNEYRREQKYNESLELLNQALFLDPDNVAAQAMKEMIEDSRIYIQARERLRERGLMDAQQSSDNIDATIPYTDLLLYPADWPRITASRLSGLEQSASESEINRQVARKLKEIVPINFDGNKLEDVIDYLRNTTNVNLIANWAALEEVGVDRAMPISMQLTNIPAGQALRLVLQQAVPPGESTDSANYSIIEGVVTISTQSDLNRTTDTRSYDIRDLLVQVPNFSDAPEFDVNSALSNTSTGGSNSNSGGGGGESGGLFGSKDDGAEESKTRQELVDEITTLIRDTVGRSEDWDAAGGTVSSMKELNGVLIMRTTPENHRQIIQLLRQLRETRALQIAIETRFLFVDQNFLDELEIDIDIQQTDPNEDANFSNIHLDQGSSDIVDRNSDFPLPDSLGNLRSLDFGISYIDDLTVNLMVNATQRSSKSIELTAPRLTLFNGQRSYVIVARQVGFVSDLTPVPDSGGFDTTLSVTQEGVILDVEATVSADRRYVTMTVQPSLASINDIRPIMQTAFIEIGSGDNAIVVPIEATIEAPDLQITSLKTSVSVPDRGTLLMGGQRIVKELELEAGVPILSKVPVLDRLFTNKSYVKDERTLLILIKPTIIVQSEEEENMFPGLQQDLGMSGQQNKAGY
jgi:type II secretory pathway component GspD/PulD (secretin)/tetratricopeptide (TPR) repeat protein